MSVSPCWSTDNNSSICSSPWKKKSLIFSPLLFPLCPVSLVRFIWISLLMSSLHRMVCVEYPFIAIFPSRLWLGTVVFVSTPSFNQNILFKNDYFAYGPGDLGPIPGRVIPKTLKWYLMPPCLTLSIIKYGSRVKWRNPGKGVPPSVHLGVVAIEKGAFESPSTMVANNFTN